MSLSTCHSSSFVHSLHAYFFPQPNPKATFLLLSHHWINFFESLFISGLLQHLQKKSAFFQNDSFYSLCNSFFHFSPQNTVKPVFKHRIVPLEINIGSTARFECDTEDAPNVNFKWFKDGHPIKEGDRYRIISRFTASSLEILSTTKDDSGEYTCKASNLHGSDECSSSLGVTGKSKACYRLFCWFSLGLFQGFIWILSYNDCFCYFDTNCFASMLFSPLVFCGSTTQYNIFPLTSFYS